jgi:hypothetical protein
MENRFDVYGAPYDLTLHLSRAPKKRHVLNTARPYPLPAALAPLVVFVLTSGILFL